MQLPREATSILDKMEPAMFDIGRRGIYTSDGVQIEDKEAIINRATGQPLGIVSEKYKILDNRQALTQFVEVLSESDIDMRHVQTKLIFLTAEPGHSFVVHSRATALN